MRNRLLAALPALLLALPARPGAAQTALQLRWDVAGGSVATDFRASRAGFKLTNRDTKPLPPSGRGIFYSALHRAEAGNGRGGFALERGEGGPHRPPPA